MCKCEICGKDFFVPVVGYWVYKREDYMGDGLTKYFCSWGCMRKFDKAYEEAKERKHAKRFPNARRKELLDEY